MIYQSEEESKNKQAPFHSANLERGESLGRSLKKGLVRNQSSNDIKNAFLDEDFQDSQCVLISEARVLLEQRKNSSLSFMNKEMRLPENSQKTLDYCIRLSKYSNKNTIRNLRNSIDTTPYKIIEIIMICNLGIESVEEAKTLIPSLCRPGLDDLFLQGTINDLKNLRKYQASSAQ